MEGYHYADIPERFGDCGGESSVVVHSISVKDSVSDSDPVGVSAEDKFTSFRRKVRITSCVFKISKSQSENMTLRKIFSCCMMTMYVEGIYYVTCWTPPHKNAKMRLRLQTLPAGHTEGCKTSTAQKHIQASAY
jgi:hypothetical protein